MSEERRPYRQQPPTWCRTIIAAAFGEGWTVHDITEAEAEAWSTALFTCTVL